MRECLYKCDNPKCGCIFTEDEAGSFREYHTEIPGDYYETFMCCPQCGCEDFFEYEEETEEEDEE